MRLSHARANPYVLDILVSVLVKKHGRRSRSLSEIADMFDILEKVGEEHGRSFFTTRKAEYEHLWGNNREALRLIQEAISKTPTIFEPRRIHAEILLKDGNKVKAREVIDHLREMANARDPDERRSNYRLYLETYARYLTDTDRFADAKALYDDPNIFTEDEKRDAVRKIEIAQGYLNRR